jgi:hypothetical protein
MTEFRTIKIKKSTYDAIWNNKPEWMSFAQYLENLLVPIGDEDESVKRLVSYNLARLQVGESVEIPAKDRDQIRNLNSHIGYVRRSREIYFHTNVRINETKDGYTVTVTRFE